MVKRFLAPLAVVGLGLCLAYAEQPKPTPSKADPAAVTKLVNQLNSERYEDREAASKELDALGGSTRPTTTQAHPPHWVGFFVSP
jgi:hypothetical protein